ncbi:MAG: low molecular weight protein-tyrosine-phosphatase [Myxococcales bacterium]|nr:low molecular weight protein-tyrosine-phosphatase [Myxococcales bacterium]
MSGHAASAPTPIRLCFVCLGNICRSPIAEGVFGELVRRRGLHARFVVASAGTGDWHVGHPADRRAIAAAAARGIDLRAHRARQFRVDDFARFDVVVAMDRSNHAVLQRLARRLPTPADLRLFMPYVDAAARGESLDVPDPYYGGPEDFERVLDLCEAGCAGLLDALLAERRL